MRSLDKATAAETASAVRRHLVPQASGATADHDVLVKETRFILTHREDDNAPKRIVTLDGTGPFPLALTIVGQEKPTGQKVYEQLVKAGHKPCVVADVATPATVKHFEEGRAQIVCNNPHTTRASGLDRWRLQLGRSY